MSEKERERERQRERGKGERVREAIDEKPGRFSVLCSLRRSVTFLSGPFNWLNWYKSKHLLSLFLSLTLSHSTRTLSHTHSCVSHHQHSHILVASRQQQQQQSQLERTNKHFRVLIGSEKGRYKSNKISPEPEKSFRKLQRKGRNFFVGN